jgi:hypothetical protein
MHEDTNFVGWTPIPISEGEAVAVSFDENGLPIVEERVFQIPEDLGNPDLVPEPPTQVVA